MISLVADNLYVADMEGCRRIENEAIIHACKFPCFKTVANKSESNAFVDENDLYLNMIDPDKPLFDNITFEAALMFIHKNIGHRKVVVHCNQGQSRSATISMLYLFKDLEYWEAQYEFSQILPTYNPSQGIDTYMETHWKEFKNIIYE